MHHIRTLKQKETFKYKLEIISNILWPFGFILIVKNVENRNKIVDYRWILMLVRFKSHKYDQSNSDKQIYKNQSVFVIGDLYFNKQFYEK